MIYTHLKPTLEQSTLYIEETLKQRCLVSADYALMTLNMSDEVLFYGKGTGRINQIKANVLNVWGSKDITVPRMMFDENQKVFGSLATPIELEQCGHSPFVDQPDALTKAILEFIG